MTFTIAFEGADQRGKSTQVAYLEQTLKGFGYKVTVLKAPFRNSWSGRLIYRMLDDGRAKTSPTLFQALQFLNKKLFLLRNKSVFKENDFIIFDRWHFSAQVYGIALKANTALLSKLDKYLPEPDLTILIHGRPYEREHSDSLDREPELQDRIQDLYLARATVNPEKCVMISNDDFAQQIHLDIITMLSYKGLLF
jgi:thymidylate kinase